LALTPRCSVTQANLGTHASFRTSNSTGRYRLDLGMSSDRMMAINLVESAIGESGNRAWRNVTLNKRPLKPRTGAPPEWLGNKVRVHTRRAVGKLVVVLAGALPLPFRIRNCMGLYRPNRHIFPAKVVLLPSQAGSATAYPFLWCVDAGAHQWRAGAGLRELRHAASGHQAHGGRSLGGASLPQGGGPGDGSAGGARGRVAPARALHLHVGGRGAGTPFSSIT
jgi:hypothetical protein